MFRQEAFIAPFITECTNNRLKAPNKAEGELWKLVANSTYGKVPVATAADVTAVASGTFSEKAKKLKDYWILSRDSIYGGVRILNSAVAAATL